MNYPSYKKHNQSKYDKTINIPSTWSEKRLKFIVSYNDESLPDKTDPDFEMKYVDISSVNLVEGITNYESINFSKAPSRARRIVRDGDTIVSTVRTYLKAIASIDSPPENLIVSTGFCVIRPTEEINKKYLSYFLQCQNFVELVVAYSVGVSYPAINPSDLVCIPIYFPKDRDLQKQIATFLGYKTQQIDKLIEKKKQLIEKLEEKRIAVITQAVTKGLDPNIKLKPSGVDWLGDVPEHWSVLRNKFNVSYIGSGKTPSGGAEVYINDGVMLLRSQNIHDDGLRLTNVVHITDKADNLQINSRVKDHDVLLNITGASIGRSSIVPKGFPKSNVNQHVCIVRPIQKSILPKYLHLLLCSQVAKYQIMVNQVGTSREGLNFPQVGNLTFPKPELEEQLSIIEYCELETFRVTKLQNNINSIINKLQEYRSALITSAVTGKIDVRNVNVPQDVRQ